VARASRQNARPVAPATSDPHEAVLELRPQAFGSERGPAIKDPIVEPLWGGVRALAAVDSGPQERVTIVAHHGEQIEGRDELEDALIDAMSHAADSVILDGYLTTDATGDGTGVVVGTADLPSGRAHFSQFLFGSRGMRAEQAAEALERDRAARIAASEDDVTFVVVDLLWLDGEWLLDVPLLERKRLLDSVVEESELVRRGAYVRQPISTWIGSWRAQGFEGLAFKDPNSRYLPGERSDAWTSSRMPRR
jgi:ATP-dependent DNA ligase